MNHQNLMTEPFWGVLISERVVFLHVQEWATKCLIMDEVEEQVEVVRIIRNTHSFTPNGDLEDILFSEKGGEIYENNF